MTAKSHRSVPPLQLMKASHESIQSNYKMPLRWQVQHACVLLWFDFSRGNSHMLISNINSPLCGSDGSNPKSVIIHMDSFPQHKGIPKTFWCNYYCSVAQSCPTLRDPMDCSTPGFPDLLMQQDSYIKICSRDGFPLTMFIIITKKCIIHHDWYALLFLWRN